MLVGGEQVYFVAAEVEQSILELDAAVAFLVLLTLVHALVHGHKTFFLLIVLMAHAVEQSSIRLGGTHCHKPGLVNVGVCQSANSVWFYVPWFYSAFFAAHRMVRKGFPGASAPFLTGAYSFAFCGAYEMQGPALKWFQWPDELQLTYPLPAGATLWQLEPDPQGRGMKIADHAHLALLERAFDFPLMAPLYHVAMGIGLMQAMQLLHGSQRLERLSPLRTLLSLFLIGPLALLWDLPIRFLEWGGVSKFTAVPCAMGLLLLAPVLCFKPSSAAAAVPSDWLLFALPLFNSAFLITRFWQHPGLVSPDLYVAVVTVTIVALLVHARAATGCGAAPPSGAASKLKTK